MKTSEEETLIEKVRNFFRPKIPSYEDVLLSMIERKFHYSLEELAQRFPKTIVANKIKEDSHVTLREFDEFSFFDATFRAAEHEQNKIYEIIKEFDYLLPESYNKENIILNNKEIGGTLLLSISRCQYAIENKNFSQYFDLLFWIVTNDEKLISCLQNKIFELSPPWFVFDDCLHAYRNYSWREDWKRFWEHLSEDKKQEYFMKYNAPEDWIHWLNTDKF